ncbi:MAG: alpha/beta hydrolase [Roseateles sp.]
MTPPPALRRRPLLQAAALLPLLAQLPVSAEQQPRVGRIERWAAYPSRHVAPRHVEVWLPPGYEARVRDGARFAVLYMHDGQMLFDARTTWNKQAWGADVAAQAVMAAGGVQDFIIVAPWNGGELRRSEYYPAGFLPHLPAALRDRYVKEALAGQPRSDAYLLFLVEELKPAVDARYATRSEREACWLMGSSMGGLISAYGLWEHPQVFGGAVCLSTHWIGTWERNAEFPAAAMAYLQARPPAPASVRLWTDRGTRELDAQYAGAHEDIAALLGRLGFAAPRFHAEVVDGTGHNETDWSRRLERVMRFLAARAA